MEIEQKVKETVAEVFRRSPSEISSSTHFVKDLHAKSANIIELIALLEDAFSVEISFAEVTNNSTVGAAAEFIQRKLAQKQASSV